MITRQDVLRTAELSRLRLSDGELDEFTGRFSQIIQMVDKLAGCPLDDSCAEDAQTGGVVRADTVAPSPARDAVLQNAPAVEAGCFLVPRTVETEG